MRLRVLARFLALAALVQQCATKQRQECGLVVVEAGAPRTGSTQQFRLVHLALNELGLGDKVSDAGYFEWPEHAKLDARAARTHNQELEVRPRRVGVRVPCCACAARPALRRVCSPVETRG